MIKKGKANVIIGGQWGSEGKGKLAGYLYRNHPEISVAISDFTPNTGHTYVNQRGDSYVAKILPIGTLFETVKLVLIGPHAVFSVDRFMKELSASAEQRPRYKAVVQVHPLATVVTAENMADEAQSLNHIASTMQGSASAQIAKIMRDSMKCHFAKDEPRLKGYIADTAQTAQYKLEHGSTILIETGQGFDLGLNHGHEWPYTTG